MIHNTKRILSDEDITTLLKESGLSATSQRIGLCRYVLCKAKHPTVENISNWAKRNGIKTSLATVYNTLHALCEAGIIKELRFPHEDKVIYDNNVEPHHHFLDEDTGRIIDIELDEFEYKSRLSDKYHVSDVDILIRGKLNK